VIPDVRLGECKIWRLRVSPLAAAWRRLLTVIYRHFEAWG
jgi:hypothetical protein